MCPIQKLQKLCKSDFSCTRFWYYSRVELICNFLGKNSCDGAGGTVKRLATRASLQRPLDNQILTPFWIWQPGYLWYNIILCWLRDCQKDWSNPWTMYLNISKVPGTITSLFLKGVAWGWFIFLGVPPMLTTISLIPTEWILMISHLCYTWWLGYSRKNSNRGGWGYTFSFFYFTLGNSIATKQSSTPGNSTKLC